MVDADPKALWLVVLTVGIAINGWLMRRAIQTTDDAIKSQSERISLLEKTSVNKDDFAAFSQRVENKIDTNAELQREERHELRNLLNVVQTKVEVLIAQQAATSAKRRS